MYIVWVLKKEKITEVFILSKNVLRKTIFIVDLTIINEKSDNKKTGINNQNENDKIGLLLASLSLKTENNQKTGIIAVEKAKTKSLFLAKNDGLGTYTQVDDNSIIFTSRFKTRKIKNQKIIQR